ncbi:MAG TPA: phosphopantothenoylcysteine decarboxylase, partial [Elusimicrobiota bacterium]|nr:phosphopantothenoylcysteine decarboxylase [Elusimicrobiota bacterium]
MKKNVRPKSPFHRKTILITSGPTREYLDPVRFISNDSSGRMGRALALVPGHDLPLALHGRHQAINTSLALAALEI